MTCPRLRPPKRRHRPGRAGPGSPLPPATGASRGRSAPSQPSRPFQRREGRRNLPSLFLPFTSWEGRTSSTWLTRVSVPGCQAALHMCPAGLLRAASWDALRPSARGAPPPQRGEAQEGRAARLTPPALCCCLVKSCVCHWGVSTSASTRTFSYLRQRGGQSALQGQLEKPSGVPETLREAESGATESSLLQGTNLTKIQLLWDTLYTFWSHSVTCTYTEYGLISSGQGQRSCCVHWTSGLQLEEVLTKLPQEKYF